MTSNIQLTDDQSEELEKLAALGYTVRELGMCLYREQEKLDQFIQEAKNSNSRIAYIIERGKLYSIAREEMAILNNAEEGNITAAQHLNKIRRTRGWQLSKLDIFGGIEDKSLLDRLENYIQEGSINNLSAEEAIYLDALTLINSISRKYGRRNTIRFFTKDPFNLSHKRASEMFDEAINLFYTDRNIEKKALRHLKAEQLEEAASVVLANAVTAKDLEIYGSLIMQAAKLQQLDKPDIEKLPVDIYQKPLRLYSLDTETIGIPKIDRQVLANQIEELEIPERDKIRLRKDALIAPFNIQDTLDELEEESKSKE